VSEANKKKVYLHALLGLVLMLVLVLFLTLVLVLVLALGSSLSSHHVSVFVLTAVLWGQVECV